MKHLTLDESASSDSRIAFRIIGPTGSRLEQRFHDLLTRRQELLALRPELHGSLLTIDASGMSGVADAFDTIVGKAHVMVEDDARQEEQEESLDQQSRKDVVARFKESQGL